MAAARAVSQTPVARRHRIILVAGAGLAAAETGVVAWAIATHLHIPGLPQWDALALAVLVAGLIAIAWLALVRYAMQARHAEEELLHQSQLAEAFFEHSLTCMALLDRRFNFVRVNAAYAQAARRRIEDYPGRNHFEMYPSDAKPIFEDVVRTKRPYLAIARPFVYADQPERGVTYWDWMLVPLLDSSGEVQTLLFSLHDVTERKRLEEQLLSARKLEAIGRLAGGIAHDFNNLLTVIRTDVGLLKGCAAPGSEHEAELKEVEAATEQGRALVRNLLSFSGRQAVELQPCDPGSLVGEVAKTVQRVLPESIVVGCRVVGEPPPVQADPGALEQVFLNLATNARDAMPSGGCFTLEVRRERLDVETVGMPDRVPPGDYVVVSASDTGTGMSPEVRQRIFEPFFTTKAPGVGTGLGLAMVFGIVKEHGGLLDVWSEPGRGTRFSIYLPAAPGVTVAAPGTAPPQGELPCGTETILLAEDQAELRRAGQRVLEKYGYRVLIAADGEEALEIFRSQGGRVDLVMTDMVMPRLGGEGSLRRRPRAGRAPAVPLRQRLRVARGPPKRRCSRGGGVHREALDAARTGAEGAGGA